VIGLEQGRLADKRLLRCQHRCMSYFFRRSVLSCISVAAWAIGAIGTADLHAIERIAGPVTPGVNTGLILGVSLTSHQAICLDEALTNVTMACPADCMIPTSVVSITTAQTCAIASASQWQCKWPTQWVSNVVNCSALNAGANWLGTATVRREFELQQCGAVIVPTSSPLQIVDTSGCTLTEPRTRTDPCPEGETGTGITYTSSVTYRLLNSLQMEEVSATPWLETGRDCEVPPECMYYPEGYMGHSAGYYKIDGTVCDDPKKCFYTAPNPSAWLTGGYYYYTTYHPEGRACINLTCDERKQVVAKIFGAGAWQVNYITAGDPACRTTNPNPPVTPPETCQLSSENNCVLSDSGGGGGGGGGFNADAGPGAAAGGDRDGSGVGGGTDE
jgi:hypothetical protein